MKPVFYIIIGVAILGLILLALAYRHRRKRGLSKEVGQDSYPFLNDETVDFVRDMVASREDRSLPLREFAVRIMKKKFVVKSINVTPSASKGKPGFIMCDIGKKTQLNWDVLSEEDRNAVMEAAINRIKREYVH